MTVPQNHQLVLSARSKVMTYLAKRDHSHLELRRKLSRNFPSEIVTVTIAWAEERGYLKPPQDLADQVARRLHRKNRSFRFILGYLRQRGLPGVSKDQDLEIEKCRAILAIKMNFSEEPITSRQMLSKMQRMLAQKGFDDETVRKVTHEKYRPA